MLPTRALQPLAEHLQEPTVGIDHRQADGRLACGAVRRSSPPAYVHHLDGDSASPGSGNTMVTPPTPDPVNHILTKPEFRRIARSSVVGSDVRGVGELAEQPRDDERDLLADVDRVVADPLERARDEHHRHRPLAPVGVGPDLDRARGTRRG